jgi:hypothetical protein
VSIRILLSALSLPVGWFILWACQGMLALEIGCHAWF